MNQRPLSIQQANQIADGKATVSADPVDARLWCVEDAGRVEAHEPMTRQQWSTFLREYWNK